jgi:hypothetical protein
MIKELINQPYAPKWEQAPKGEQEEEKILTGVTVENDEKSQNSRCPDRDSSKSAPKYKRKAILL